MPTAPEQICLLVDRLEGQTMSALDGALLTKAAMRMARFVARSGPPDQVVTHIDAVIAAWDRSLPVGYRPGPDETPTPRCDITMDAQRRLLEAVADAATENLIEYLLEHRDRLARLAIERATSADGAAYGDASWRRARAELAAETDDELADAIVYECIRLWSPITRTLLGIEVSHADLLDTLRPHVHRGRYDDSESAEARPPSKGSA